MNKLAAFIAATVVSTATSVSAADMPVKAPPIAVAPASAWTGFYLGAHIGDGWGSSSTSLGDPGDAAISNCAPCFAPGFVADTAQRGGGITGGGQLGYNWQLGNSWLVGLEGDFTASGIRETGNVPLTGFTVGGTPFFKTGSNLSGETDNRWLASIRGRLGATFDDWFLYATGGVAWGDFKFSANATCFDIFCNPLQAPAGFSKVRTGWVAGGGVEWQTPLPHWRASVEYLYYQFDGTDTISTPWTIIGTGPAGCLHPVGGSCPATYTFGNLNIQTVSFAISYAFH